jgi:hypothetical protein
MVLEWVTRLRGIRGLFRRWGSRSTVLDRRRRIEHPQRNRDDRPDGMRGAKVLLGFALSDSSSAVHPHFRGLIVLYPAWRVSPLDRCRSIFGLEGGWGADAEITSAGTQADAGLRYGRRSWVGPRRMTSRRFFGGTYGESACCSGAETAKFVDDPCNSDDRGVRRRRWE